MTIIYESIVLFQFYVYFYLHIDHGWAFRANLFVIINIVMNT